MRLGKSEQILIIIALILLVIVIFNKIYIIPQKDQVELLKDMLSSKKELYKEYLFSVKNKDYFEKELSKLEKEYKKIKGLVWEEKEYQEIASSFLDIIDNISQKAKVNILKKNILQKKAYPFFDEVKISLEIKAPLPNILYFLYLLRNQKKLIIIKKFSIYIPQEGIPITNLELATLRYNK